MSKDNPLYHVLPTSTQINDLSKSNRVVAFNVSIGDQDQNMFKNISVNQNTIKNSSESFRVMENIGRSATGASAYLIDQGLYEYYRNASYECTVTMLGNVMIQPTMYFYLKNVPMFKGTYWITEVSHSIKNNNIITTFKGARMPYTQLPDPQDSFTSAYRTLFDKMTQNAVAKVNNADKNKTQKQSKSIFYNYILRLFVFKGK